MVSFIKLAQILAIKYLLLVKVCCDQLVYGLWTRKRGEGDNNKNFYENDISKNAHKQQQKHVRRTSKSSEEQPMERYIKISDISNLAVIQPTEIHNDQIKTKREVPSTHKNNKTKYLSE